MSLISDSIAAFNFQDDEPVTIIPASFSKFLQKSKLSLNFATNYIHITTSFPVDLPVSLTFECAEPIEKLGSDIVCIIELSRRISSSWLDAIQKCLTHAIKELSPNDRLSLVGFNSKVYKLIGLVAGTYSGKLKLNRVVKELACEGDTEVVEAVKMGLRVLKNRIYINNNSSVVLLSASPDLNSNSALERAEESLEEFKDIEFSFNSIGLSSGHSAELLNFYSLTGNYRAIASPCSLSEAFPGIFTSLKTGKIHNLALSISASSAIPVEISKVFKHSSTLQFGKTLSIVFLMTAKHFIGEMNERIHLNAKITHKFECFECRESIDVYGPSWIIEEIEIDEGVMGEYFKEKILESMLAAIDGNLASAKKVMDAVVGEAKESYIGNSKIFASFLGEIVKLQVQIGMDSEWSENNKSMMLSVLRRFWGKPLAYS